MTIKQALSWLYKQPLLDPDTLPGALILAVVVFLACSLASRILGRIMRRSSGLMARLAHGRVDETMLRYVLRIKTVAVYLAGGMLFASLVPGLRLLLGTVVASAGITAVVMGFAAKSALGNLISGLSLAFYRPIRIGDKVSMDGQFGTVEDITLRHTIVRLWDARRLIIPNEKLDGMTLTNYSIIDSKALLSVTFGVSYDTDIDLARRLILEEVAACPRLLPPETAPAPPAVLVAEWAESSVILRLNAWVANMDDYWGAKFMLQETVKKRFDQEGVEIPFPYRTIVYKKDLAPPPGGGPASAPDGRG
ncbi:MAG: mechanosensitive ion channel family protein [Pseudomonadota bacterium]